MAVGGTVGDTKGWRVAWVGAIDVLAGPGQRLWIQLVDPVSGVKNDREQDE